MALILSDKGPQLAGGSVSSVFFSAIPDVQELVKDLGWWVDGQGVTNDLGSWRDVHSFNYVSSGRPAIVQMAALVSQAIAPTNLSGVSVIVGHNIFSATKAKLIVGQTQAQFDGTGTLGTFDSGTGAVVGEVLTLQDGAQLLVEGVNVDGKVTGFSIQATDPKAVYADPLQRQLVSSSGALTEFVIKPKLGNFGAIPGAVDETGLLFDALDETAESARKFGPGNFDIASFTNTVSFSTLIRPAAGDSINLGSTIRRARIDAGDTSTVQLGKRWIQVLELG